MLKGKRSKSLLKFKKFQTEEFKCIDIVPQKYCTNVTGSIILKLPNGKTFSATPKCTLTEKKEIWTNRNHYLNSYFLGIVQFFDKTIEGNPSFSCISWLSSSRRYLIIIINIGT